MFENSKVDFLLKESTSPFKTRVQLHRVVLKEIQIHLCVLLNNTYPFNFIVCDLFKKKKLVMTYLYAYIWVNFHHNSCDDTFDCTW